MKAAGIILLLLVWHTGFSQWTDNFADGNFTLNPLWSGNAADFIIENNVLKLSAPAVSGQSFLSTPSSNISDATWQLSVRLQFNPSSSNYAKIYLVANSAILNEALNGYFVKIGGSSDEVSLYRQDGIDDEEIIDGTNERLSLSVVNVDVLVTRSADGQWQLFSRIDDEADWHNEGSVVDHSHLQSLFFGISCVYTATRSTKFSFDNIIVTGEPYLDLEPPLVDTVYTSGNNTVNIVFNEPIDPASATSATNYLLNQQIHPISVVSSNNNVVLEFDKSLAVINNLNITGLKDLAQNVLVDNSIEFIYVDPLPVQVGDIIINEIMSDPTPGEGLPEIEYVEIYNTSDRAINMTGWSFSDKTSITKLPGIIILPDSFLILSHKTNAGLLQEYGKAIGLSPWPSLNNSGDSLGLANAQKKIVDIVVYTDDWYTDTSKQDGGWSLERINPDQPCSGYLNWQASGNTQGGTPGKKNSVLNVEDSAPPSILNFRATFDSLIVKFDEPISNNLGTISINLSNSVDQTKVDYNELYILTSQPFLSNQTNEVVFSSVSDCFNNTTTSLNLSFITDFEPPEVDTVFSNYPDILEVYFTEDIQKPQLDDFHIDVLGWPTSLEHDLLDRTHVSLSYHIKLNYAEEYNIVINKVRDINNNMTIQSQYLFSYLPLRYPQFAELIITEIMADPSPQVNLPEAEYIELTNNTTKRLLLKGLILADARDEVQMPAGIIEPNERVILSKTSAVEAFTKYGRTFGIPNWPTLNNTADEIMILDTGYQVIHHVGYTNDWYDDDEKKKGGWSLELIDEVNYCAGNSVWTASTSTQGGTPGAENSIRLTLPDFTVPHIAEVFAISSDTIMVKFTEPLTNLLPDISISNLSVVDLYFSNYSQDEVLIIVEQMQPRIAYEILLAKVIDCAGNINDEEKVSVFLPEVAEEGDVLFSEILFNPRGDGADFIEIYNNSARYISLIDWQLSNGSSATNITSARALAPYSFRVFTTLPENIISTYPNAVSKEIFKQRIPSMNNESGSVVLFDDQQREQDAVDYEEAWHFPYLASVDGISLERIDFDQPGDLSTNWASAAASENYATPGYHNSQSVTGTGVDALSVSPRVIVPDANGRDDFTTIEINQPGSMASITIYNLQGQIIKQIAQNTLVGGSSAYTWDGTDNNGTVVALGHYIVVVNLISTGGLTRTLRQKVVVGTGF